MSATAVLKPSRLRACLRHHPWVYANSVLSTSGDYAPGDAVLVRAPDGRFLAHAFISEGSRLKLRLVSFVKDAPADGALLAQRTRDAIALRHEVLGLPARTDAYRVIHSEGDGIPGLIVDRYGEVLVVSTTCLGTFLRLDAILDVLEEVLQPAAILEREVGESLREREGLPASRGVLRGKLPEGLAAGEPCEVTIDGTVLGFDLAKGQKTGLFLDQRESVARLRDFASGRRVLDVCSYVGAFGISLVKAGAKEALLIDGSRGALEQAERNAARNGVAEQIKTLRSGLHGALKELAQAGETFDLVILDPPKFAKRKQDLKSATRGYREANQLALKVLAPGGLLLTCSCSGHMSVDALEGALGEAAQRAGARLRVLERRGAGPDHPSDVHCPDGRYLKSLLVQRTR